MIDYSNIKNSYIAALHVGLMLNAGYEEAKEEMNFCINSVRAVLKIVIIPIKKNRE